MNKVVKQVPDEADEELYAWIEAIERSVDSVQNSMLELLSMAADIAVSGDASER